MRRESCYPAPAMHHAVKRASNLWTCRWLACALGLGAAGCLGPGKPGASDAGTPLSVQIGARRAAGDNTFVPLEAGGDIHLGTLGQGGTHAELAVRCIGFGKRVFVSLALENLRDHTRLMYPATSRPQLLRCVEDPPGACDLLPIYFMTGGLAAPDAKDGLPVRVEASCRNEAGQMAETQIEGVLRADAAVKRAFGGDDPKPDAAVVAPADEDAGAAGG